MTELSTLPDGGLIQPADQFVIARSGAARRVSGSRFVLTDAAGNALLSGNPSMPAGAQLRSGNAPLIGGDAGANTALYTGTAALNVRNATDSATLLSLSNSGAMALSGTLGVTGSIRQNGNQVWHAGNLDPSAYLPASAATNYMLKSGGAFAGNVEFRGPNDDKFQIFSANPYFSAWNAAGSSRYGYIQFGEAGASIVSDRGSVSLFHKGGVALRTLDGGVSIPGGLFVDNQFFFKTTGSDGLLLDVNFDDGDLVRFARQGNIWNWFINGAPVASLNNSSFSHAGDISAGSFVRAGTGMTVGGNDVFHRGNFNPANYQPAGSYQPAGNYAVAEKDVIFRDVYANRGDGTGVLSFGSVGGGTYIQYDGTNYVMVKAGTVIARFNQNECRFRGDARFNLGDAV